MTENCEALVIGGGPAGAVTAALLARAGWSVVVLERKTFPRRKVCGEYLSPGNRPLFRRLDLLDQLHREAGPEVRRLGLFVGRHRFAVELPPDDGDDVMRGRALSRERLDTLLLTRAAEWGADVRQPYGATSLVADADAFVCRAVGVDDGATVSFRAPVVVLAHGSWESGELPSQSVRDRSHRGDLLGFKAHFRHAMLDDDLMPLLSFPGGYGGLVHTDDGRVSLSCCVRRDRLRQLRSLQTGPAGRALQMFLERQIDAVGDVLRPAKLDGRWLASGVIRPGIRSCYADGVFRIGNAAGEAHPAIAEGITMALQSAAMLVDQLISERNRIDRPSTRDEIGRRYAAQWRAAFAPRIRASSLVAHWAMRPTFVAACMPLLKRRPNWFVWAARRCGKAATVCGNDVGAFAGLSRTADEAG